MYRAIATLVIVFFLLGVMTLTFPVVEEVAQTVEQNDKVQQKGWGDKTDSVRQILFIGVPLFAGGGTCLFVAVWMIRKERFRGRRGLR